MCHGPSQGQTSGCASVTASIEWSVRNDAAAVTLDRPSCGPTRPTEL